MFEAFCTKNEDFDQAYVNTSSKTQNVEELRLDLIFHNNFLQTIKSFSKQNSKLRNHSKLTVCIGSIIMIIVTNKRGQCARQIK